MSLTIQISDQLAAALEAQARAEGLAPDGYVGQVLREKLDAASEDEPVRRPLKNSYGILAKYGAAPSDEDIAEVRREMWANFPRDAPND